jgi:hypothetical protein
MTAVKRKSHRGDQRAIQISLHGEIVSRVYGCVMTRKNATCHHCFRTICEGEISWSYYGDRRLHDRCIENYEEAKAIFAVAVAFVVLVIFDEQTILANVAAFWGSVL